MLNIVLVEPEIPANTGNVARTCAATGATLHLIKPLGFEITDKALKRAGLDYWHLVDVRVYEDLNDFFERTQAADIWLLSTKAPRGYADVTYSKDCYLFFGKETRGLPETLLKKYRERTARIPMLAQARSLNLGNSVAIVAYEALRQQSFPFLIAEGRMLNW